MEDSVHGYTVSFIIIICKWRVLSLSIRRHSINLFRMLQVSV
jgi:hypothetical protein